jgi:hypothetical protein
VRNVFAEFEEIGITAQTCSDDSRVAGILSNSQFEALVLHFNNVTAGASTICWLRESSSSNDAIVFCRRYRNLDSAACFRWLRDLCFWPAICSAGDSRRIADAYAFMLRDRRRYFRCPVEHPVQITRTSGQKLQGMTSNVSGNGMAAVIPCHLQVGEGLELPNRYVRG